MTSVLITCPTYRGLKPHTKQFVDDLQMFLSKQGISSGYAELRGCNLIQIARSELVALFLRIPQKCDFNLSIDDDISMPVWNILDMMNADVDICIAPCLESAEPHNWNIRPREYPVFESNGIRLVECESAGHAVALYKREALQQVSSKFAPMLSYRSTIDHTSKSVALHQLILAPREGEKEVIWQGEDWSFTFRLNAAGIKTYAAIDIETNHDGLAGCLGDAFPEPVEIPTNGHLNIGGK